MSHTPCHTPLRFNLPCTPVTLFPLSLSLSLSFFFFFCRFLFCLYLLEKAMSPHSSTLAWKIPWTEEPGRLQSMGSRRVRHDWVTSLSLFTFMHWRRKWQPTPVFLPGESQRWGCRVRHDCSDLATIPPRIPRWR